MKKRIALLGLIISLFSCGVTKQLVGIYALTQCKYIIESIVNLTLGGINLQNVNSFSSLNPIAAANLIAAFSSPNGSLPMSFTINMGVTNPGVQTALLNGADYILEIDGMEMTQGAIKQQLQVAPGQKAVMPVTIGFDLKKVMSGKSLDVIKNLAFNFAGLGESSSNLTVKLKPSFDVNGSIVSTPDFVPISFTMNKKN